ncbi:DUF6415 family natural product biosynthesis protein [Streptomyces platensis]|uniref:DUF6415 family natural product biosynthesis protein n=1 Tax=Streptomyces platensis TaxID=58346 RepID=UPI0030E38F07
MNRPDATLDVPIDPDTVGETIRRALQLGTGRPDLGELSAMHCALRAHISHLLPAARTSAARLPQGAVTAHELKARLDGIEQRAGQQLQPNTFDAHVQIAHLARDCQCLLARHTAAARP